MRAAILLVPFAAFAAAWSAGAPPVDPYAEFQVDDDSTAMNAADDGMNGMEMEMSTDMNMVAVDDNSMDMNMMENAVDMTDTNMATPAPERPPAWMADGTWLIAGQERSTIFWYFEPFESDFTVTPHRVVLRTDETADAASPHNNTARVAEIDCAANRYRILRTTHYDDAGNATEANERGDGSMMTVRRGTVFEYVANTICHHAESQRCQNGRQETTFNGM